MSDEDELALARKALDGNASALISLIAMVTRRGGGYLPIGQSDVCARCGGFSVPAKRTILDSAGCSSCRAEDAMDRIAGLAPQN